MINLNEYVKIKFRIFRTLTFDYDYQEFLEGKVGRIESQLGADHRSGVNLYMVKWAEKMNGKYFYSQYPVWEDEIVNHSPNKNVLK